MARRALLVAVFALATCLTATGGAAAHTLDFEDLPDGRVVDTEYLNAGGSNQGPRFGVAPTGNRGEKPVIDDVGSDARSGTKVAEAGGCGQEFCQDGTVWARFAFQKSFVRVRVSAAAGVPVRLTAYNANGQAIGTEVKDMLGSGNFVTLEVTNANSQIVFISVGQDATIGLQFNRINYDDLEYSTPAPGDPPPPPDFGIVYDPVLTLDPSGDVSLTRGKTAQVHIDVTRVNASSGPIAYSVGGLPDGVTGTFEPASPTAADELALTLSASAGAALGTRLVTITATPASATAGASPRTLSFRVDVHGQYDVRVTGIEVNQAVQTDLSGCALFEFDSCANNTASLPARDSSNPAAAVPYSGVRLVAGSKTIVRVYGNTASQGETVEDVGVTLHGTGADGKPLPGSPLVDGGRTLTSGRPFATYADRQEHDSSWWFTLPPSWAKGTVRLRAVLNLPLVFFGASECETDLCQQNNRFELSGVKFEPTAPIAISTVYMYAAPDGPFGDGKPCPKDVFGPVRATAPMAEDQLSHGGACSYEASIDITDLAAQYTADSDDANSAVADRLEEWADDHPSCERRLCSDQVIGVNKSLARGVARGKLTEGDDPVAVVKSGRRLNSVAHEVHHGWGRTHASPCGGGGSNGQNAELWPPDNEGWTGGVGIDKRQGSGGSDGFRIIAAPSGVTGDKGTDGQFYDFMSYCAGDEDRAWTSVLGWNKGVSNLRFIRRIREIGLIPAYTELASGVKFRPGTPGRAWLDTELRRARLVEATERAETAQAEAPTLRVRATVGVDGAVQIGTVKPGVGAPFPADPFSSYRLVARDAGGAELVNVAMGAEETHVDGLGGVTLLTGQIAAANVTRVEIVRNGNVLASRDASASTPTVSVTAPKARARVGSGSYRVRWKAADADGNALLAKVDYSPDDGRSWETVYIGPNTGSATIRGDQLSRSSRARMRVRVNDGFREGQALSKRFTAEGRPPLVEITSPGSGGRVPADETVLLAGTALDDRGLSMSDKQLTWFDGRRKLGRGAQRSLRGLRPGKHRLRLVARDRHRRESAAAVTLRVTGTPPQFTELVAPTSVSPKAKSVTLRVASSLAGSTLSLKRQKAAVGLKARKVKLRVKPATGPLTLKLRLAVPGHARKVTVVVPRG